jgi:hypothetical protein
LINTKRSRCVLKNTMRSHCVLKNIMPACCILKNAMCPRWELWKTQSVHVAFFTLPICVQCVINKLYLVQHRGVFFTLESPFWCVWYTT